MASSEVAIANLVYRYAELIDSGDLEATSRLFSHAKVYMGPELGEVGAETVLDLWHKSFIFYDGGSPRCKHVITNPIIEVDEDAGTGTCRSYYTVMQQAEDGPLEAVICGRYHDEFERVDGTWRFSRRDYSLHDLPGDLSRHSHTFSAR